MESAAIRTVRKGDVVRFASYALRIEAEPVRLSGTGVRLSGRSSVDGCPLVTKTFLDGAKVVRIERCAP